MNDTRAKKTAGARRSTARPRKATGATPAAPNPSHEAAAKLSHAELNQLGAAWLRNMGFTAFTECGSQYAPEVADVIGWKHSGASVVLESKRSLSDFERDKKKVVRTYADMGFGELRYYLCPAGLLQPEQMPEGWGLLWGYTGRVVMKKQAKPFDSAKAAVAEKRLLTALLYRNDKEFRELCERTKNPLPNRLK